MFRREDKKLLKNRLNPITPPIKAVHLHLHPQCVIRRLCIVAGRRNQAASLPPPPPTLKSWVIDYITTGALDWTLLSGRRRARGGSRWPTSRRSLKSLLAENQQHISGQWLALRRQLRPAASTSSQRDASKAFSQRLVYAQINAARWPSLAPNHITSQRFWRPKI